MEPRIYLDHAATTPVAKPVVEAMLPYFTNQFGNASSRSHSFGWNAAAAIEKASKQLADLLGVSPEEFTFTSGSTEAINLALKGIAERYGNKGRHIVTSLSEHSAVLDTCRELENKGFEITYLIPENTGLISPESVANSLRKDTIICALMWANNETGVLNEIEQIGKICHEKKVIFFSDATQAVGKVDVFPKLCGVSALALSAHKFYGPMGVGALWVNDQRPKISVKALFQGGGQQNGLRPGTLNVPGIVGMGAAAVLAKAEQKREFSRLAKLRDNFETALAAALQPVLINGGEVKRLPHISNISIRFTEAEALLSGLNRRLALATGSACASADLTPSHVLLSMGLDEQDAKSSIRVSLGRDTTEEEMTTALNLITESAKKLRKESPSYELFLDGSVT